MISAEFEAVKSARSSTNNGENVFGKIDYNLSSSQQFTGRFNYVSGSQDNISTNPNAAVGTNGTSRDNVYNEMGSYNYHLRQKAERVASGDLSR